MTAIVDHVLADPPALHGDETDPTLYGLNEPALRCIAEHVRPGDVTLETGCGFSTLVFVGAGARHTCIVPDAAQAQRIETYLQRRPLGSGAVEFHLEPSEWVLPRLDRTPLDVVLLDGSHAFPQVFIDWFYTAHRLRVGGYLLVDDIHLWTGKVLRGFLSAESSWSQEALLAGRTAFFRKTAETPPAAEWTDQPYVARRSRAAVVAQARIVMAMLSRGRYGDVVQALRRAARGR